MFRFEDSTYLYLLAVIPILALLRFVMTRAQKKRLRKFGDPKLVRQLMPDVSHWRPLVKFWLLQAALALIILRSLDLFESISSTFPCPIIE